MAQTLVASQRPLAARPAKQQMRARRAALVRNQAAAAPTMAKGEIKDKTAELAINGAPKHPPCAAAANVDSPTNAGRVPGTCQQRQCASPGLEAGGCL